LNLTLVPIGFRGIVRGRYLGDRAPPSKIKNWASLSKILVISLGGIYLKVISREMPGYLKTIPWLRS